tara:strand:+ start:74 stop:424 length:351 start_codon:yes stop_codon:yes gene_type:complete
MITTKKNGMTLIDSDLLDSNHFKYAYTDRLFEELGMEEFDGVEPIRGDDPWYIQGDLHGIAVSATFNTYENITLSVFDEKISYKDSMKDTLNSFIETYREKWNEHHHSRRQKEGNM